MSFDFFFNLQIPNSTDTVIVLRPVGKTFINGLGRCYEEEYDERLRGRITRQEFTSIIEKINDRLGELFPCCPIMALGYIFSPCTCGFSLYMPGYCVNDAEEFATNQIARSNRQVLNKKGIEMVLVRKIGTSWLELRLTSPVSEMVKEDMMTSSAEALSTQNMSPRENNLCD